MRTNLLFGMFAAPVTFLVNLSVAYLAATTRCQSPRLLFINGLTVGCLGLIVTSGLMSWLKWKTLRANGDQDQLLAMLGAAGAALFALVNLMLLLAAQFVPPCG